MADAALQQLQNDVAQAYSALNISERAQQLADAQTASQQPDFWSGDTAQAQATMQQIAQLETQVAPWQALQRSVHDLAELAALNDPSLQTDINAQVAQAQQQFNDLKGQLKLSQPYDDHDAILTLSAGAGGADAQDWAAMLLRMYLRYAEKAGFKATIIEQSAGEADGIKSATVSIAGNYAYGRLRSEHGVHRLVRLSPFNAESRETSFAKVELSPKIDHPNEVNIDEKDLKIDVYRAGGHGGQSVNTTDSAVRVTHLPTGISVAIQNERSQLQNREMALTILRGRLAQLQMEQHAEQLSQLKGPNEQAAWGNQIRSYVLHPYKQVKDVRSGHISNDPDAVLDGELQAFSDAYLDATISS